MPTAILLLLLAASVPAPQAPKPPAIPATGFVMPDLPDEWRTYTSYDGRWASTAFNLVALIDYNAFGQDDDSRAQVGEQEDEWDTRTVRLMSRGRVKFAHPLDYFVSVEVKGRDHVQNEDSKWGFTDLSLSTAVGPLGRLAFGKIKEPFVYEMVGDAANLQQQERALNPFFTSRGIGLRLSNTFAGDAMSWSLGWYNDWWIADQSFKESGNEFAARLTAVPYGRRDGEYLHLGVSYRYLGADVGALRFRGRPESNVSDYYVDSGSLAGDHADEAGLEALWGRGPVLVAGEYVRAMVAADAAAPRFWGTFITASYLIAGTPRPYDRQVAYARRVQPASRWGAWEIVGRYSHADVDDGPIAGGIFDRATAGLNWWATRRWKLGVDYGYVVLDRFGVTGVTHAVHSRFQWIY
jgi:phosphate-selective porin